MTDVVAPFDEHESSFASRQQAGLPALLDTARPQQAARSRHRRPHHYATLVRRLTQFALINAAVFAAGSLLQLIIMREHLLSSGWAYAAPTAAAMELAYTLNRRWTWQTGSQQSRPRCCGGTSSALSWPSRTSWPATGWYTSGCAGWWPT
jgi:hypothetical protein